jgi:hypothetical protein
VDVDRVKIEEDAGRGHPGKAAERQARGQRLRHGADPKHQDEAAQNRRVLGDRNYLIDNNLGADEAVQDFDRYLEQRAILHRSDERLDDRFLEVEFLGARQEVRQINKMPA